ncbi:hypothetical protein AB3X94_37215 [Paraburkholderia sp. BR10923]|uniref:hypothetical protein n=1 Tax=Paraburkholderia sp. BR10923 TaxID=3236992 RepID=UPI0034CD1F69
MRRVLWFVAFVLMTLASCESLQTNDTAQHALRVFCALHRADILATLLTPEQQRAGAVVCSAVGMTLGT